MRRVAALIRHLRSGTLRERLAVSLGRLPARIRVRWEGAETLEEGIHAATQWGETLCVGGGWLLTVGDGSSFHQKLNDALARRGLKVRSHALAEVLGWDALRADGLKGILCASVDARGMTDAARRLAAHPVLSSIPFEHVAGLYPERRLFARRDEYRDTWFVAPALLDSPTPYAIYEESLAHNEQKCGLRDYLDLYQALRHVVRGGVEGDIAEFGSYRGHSGWLIARTLQALESDKRVWLFDTFEEFPAEASGVDHFWNRSHYVDFEEVRARFRSFPNVTLVKGDFTETLATSGLGRLALAYVDCDSYRATRFLIDTLWERHLDPGSLLACEDYGHPALLGNRAAVHDELDRRSDAFRFFSQFSGLYIALKLPSR